MNFNIDYHIYDLRNAQKLSLRALADKSGISKTEICDIENGLYHPTVYTICRLSLALNASPYKLFTMHITD